MAAGVRYQRKFTSAREGGSPTSQELMLCGNACASLLCWNYITGKECSCDGKLAHILQGVCGRAINEAFGRVKKMGGCQGSACRAAEHPKPENICKELGDWWLKTHGEQPVFSTEDPVISLSGNTTGSRGSRGSRSTMSTESSELAPSRRPMAAARLMELLSSHAADSKYIAAFLNAPFLEQMLEDDSLRSLLSMRSRVKELSETYAVWEAILPLISPSLVATGGEGVLLFDVCSGKGLAATLLSFLLPRARVIMVDANGGNNKRPALACDVLSV